MLQCYQIDPYTQLNIRTCRIVINADHTDAMHACWVFCVHDGINKRDQLSGVSGCCAVLACDAITCRRTPINTRSRASVASINRTHFAGG